MTGEWEFLKWILHEYGPAIIPTITALLLAYHVVRKKGSDDILDDYHMALVANTKAMEHLATLLDERTRKLDVRAFEQDERQERQDQWDRRRASRAKDTVPVGNR